MSIRLRIIQVAPKGGPIERIKAEPPKDYDDQMITELTTEEVIKFIDNKNLHLWTNVSFYTEVEGTSEVTDVTKYGDKRIRSLKNDTEEDNLLNLPPITLDAWEFPLDFEGLKNWIQRQLP